MTDSSSRAILNVRVPNHRISFNPSTFTYEEPGRPWHESDLENFEAYFDILSDPHTEPTHRAANAKLGQYRQTPVDTPKKAESTRSNNSQDVKEAYCNSEKSAPTFLLSRTPSEASINSMLSEFTTPSSVTGTVSTSSSFKSDNASEYQSSLFSYSRRKLPERHLPQPILEQIISNVLGISKATFLIEWPIQKEPIPRRYRNRGSRDRDLQDLLSEPIFRVSKQFCHTAFSIIYRQGLFKINLHATCVPSYLQQNAQTGKEERDTTAPSWVKHILTNISKLQIHISVPCIEPPRSQNQKLASSLERGDSVRANRLDTAALFDRICTIASLIGSTAVNTTPQIHESPSTRHELSHTNHTPNTINPLKRNTPLKLLQIIFIKETPTSTVLPATMKLLPFFAHIIHRGNLEYYLEMAGQKRLWALQKSGLWIGREPDGVALLRDLQALRPMHMQGSRDGGVNGLEGQSGVSRKGLGLERSVSRKRSTTWGKEYAMRKYDFSFVAEKKAREAAEKEKEKERGRGRASVKEW